MADTVSQTNDGTKMLPNPNHLRIHAPAPFASMNPVVRPHTLPVYLSCPLSINR
jgi:hypothetical protein